MNPRRRRKNVADHIERMLKEKNQGKKVKEEKVAEPTPTIKEPLAKENLAKNAEKKAEDEEFDLKSVPWTDMISACKHFFGHKIKKKVEAVKALSTVDPGELKDFLETCND